MTKDELKAFRAMSLEGQQLLEQIRELESRIYVPKVQQISGMPMSHGGDGHSMDSAVSVHLRLQDKYQAQLDYLSQLQLRIEAAIEPLEPAQRMVIRYRYIDGLDWEQVCTKMRYSWRQTHRLHAAALRALENQT